MVYRVVRALPTSRPPPRSGASPGPQVPHPTSCSSPGPLRFRLTFSLTAPSPAPMLGHPTITVLLPVIAQPHGGCLAPHFRSGRLRAQRWFSTWALRVAPNCAAGTSADDPGTAVVHKQQVAAAELPTLEDTRKRPSGASAGEPGEPSIHRRASNYEKRAYTMSPTHPRTPLGVRYTTSPTHQ